MRKFLNYLILVPLGVAFIVFAVANRQLVMLTLDPFSSGDMANGVALPLFVVIIAVGILGVIVGGVTTWFQQRHWRRSARNYEAEAQSARAELATLRASVATAARTAPPVVSEPRGVPQLGSPAQNSG